MNQFQVDGNAVISQLGARIAELEIALAKSDVHIASLTAERDALAARLPDEAEGSPPASADTA